MSKLKKQLIISGVILLLFAIMLTVYFIATRTEEEKSPKRFAMNSV